MADAAYDEAEKIARRLAISVQGLVRAGVIVSRANKVRILSRDELDPNWDPLADKRLTVWECTQHVIRNIEKSESDAAQLVKRLGIGRSEDARALAYRLYSICQRKKWTQEALAYNSLVVAWPEVLKLAGKTAVRSDDLRLNI
jgi:putative DNA methylase